MFIKKRRFIPLKWYKRRLSIQSIDKIKRKIDGGNRNREKKSVWETERPRKRERWWDR